MMGQLYLPLMVSRVLSESKKRPTAHLSDLGMDIYKTMLWMWCIILLVWHRIFAFGWVAA